MTAIRPPLLILNEDPDPDAPASESTAAPLPSLPPLYADGSLEVCAAATGALVDVTKAEAYVSCAVGYALLALVANMLCGRLVEIDSRVAWF